MLFLSFKLPTCLFGRDMSVMHEKAKFFFLYETAKNEIKICSNKHETGLILTINWNICKPCRPN